MRGCPRAWARALGDAGAADADALHLHHLTPIHEAASRVAPHVPVIGHLHGTELLMLEDPGERTRRGTIGQRVAIQRYGWPALARRLADVLDAAVTGGLTH